MQNSMLKNSLFNILKNLTTLFFPLVTFSYASRILLPEGMGQIDFSKALTTILIMLAMLGMKHYGTRECAKVRDDKKKLSKVVKELLSINFFTTLLAYLALFAMLLFSEKINSYKEIVLIYSFLIVLTTIGVEWLYTALEDFKYVALRTCGVQVIALVLMLLFVRSSDDVWVYALVQVISSGGAFFIGFLHSRRYIDYKIKCKLNLKKHIKPLVLLFITGAFIEMYVSLDSVMLGAMTEEKFVGYYSSAYKISTALCTIILAILQVIVPRISYYAEKGMKNELKKLMNQAMSISLLLDIPFAIGSFMLSDYLVIILSGAGFVAATTASKVLALRLLVGPTNYFLIYNLFIPLKKDKYAVIVTLTAALTDIIVNLVLIPRLQHIGAAISTVAAEYAIFIIGMILSRKLIDFFEPFKKLWQYVIAAMPIIPICYFLSYLELNMIIYVVLATILSAVIYFAILILLKNPIVNEGKELVIKLLKTKAKDEGH